MTPPDVLLHDTRSGELRRLEPTDPPKVRIYACGPTVYGRIHVGNARPYVVFSQLKRFLDAVGYETELVANITDINDKIYATAAASGVPSDRLAREMTDAYIADTDRFGLGRPDHEPRASRTIGPIIALIQQLIDSGHAYVADGDVLFSVRSYPGYGALSHVDVNQMDQGEGVEGADRKRDPLDFALWKAQKPGEDTSWEAPWGRGRPGWHIECSAMAQELLGLEFEIHGGGSDLIFPHHENEDAQTTAATGMPLAQIWMHNGMLRLDAEKMSKSVGNVFGLAEALDRYGPLTLLMYFSQGHWRQPLEYDEDRLRDAAATAERIRNAGRRLIPGPSPQWSAPLRRRFFDALAHDFNTPRALAVVFEWVSAANRADAGTVGSDDLAAMLYVLGLERLLDADDGKPPEAALELARRRDAARRERDYAEADRLRDELREQGWEVRDGPSGTELVPLDRA
ncbi:MAG TPA: cysteine--tRNA ligase [Solirubrobacteraceae bacterium]|nr:cysteine--tRNA ligase [Solirubrobacteraceae bacterium]